MILILRKSYPEVFDAYSNDTFGGRVNRDSEDGPLQRITSMSNGNGCDLQMIGIVLCALANNLQAIGRLHACLQRPKAVVEPHRRGGWLTLDDGSEPEDFSLLYVQNHMMRELRTLEMRWRSIEELETVRSRPGALGVLACILLPTTDGRKGELNGTERDGHSEIANTLRKCI